MYMWYFTIDCLASALCSVPMSIRVTEAVSSHFKQMWYITYEVDVMSSSEWVLYLRNYISTHFFKFTQHIKSSIRCCCITCNSDTIKSMQFKSMTSRMIGQIFSPLRCVVRYCTTEMKRMVWRPDKSSDQTYVLLPVDQRMDALQHKSYASC